MKNRLISAIAILFFSLSILPVSAQARIPLLDPALGYAADWVLWAAGQSSLDFTQAYKQVEDPQARRRVRRSIDRLKEAGIDLRYEDPTVRIVRGSAAEPNAFSTGPSVYVSIELLELLDDRLLDAAVAHELAHAEEGHLPQRMTHGFAATLIQFGRLVASDYRSIRDGQADPFMRRLWKEGHWQMIQEMIMHADRGKEMEADDIAYCWLERMGRRGYRRRGTDLADAIETAVGVNREWLSHSDFLGGRIHDIESFNPRRCRHWISNRFRDFLGAVDADVNPQAN